MESPVITAPPPTDPLFGSGFGFPSSWGRVRVLSAVPPSAKAVAAGLFMTVLQVALAIGLLAPEGDAGDRYRSLLQHDSYWFMNIVNNGYRTPVPPIEHKVMEVSNVAFFPAYPLIGRALQRLCG